MPESHIAKMNDKALGEIFIYQDETQQFFAVCRAGTSGGYKTQEALLAAFVAGDINWSGGVPTASAEPVAAPKREAVTEGIVRKRGRKKKKAVSPEKPSGEADSE
tara:strand:- start:2013 stop:2327 length:315 start_codon:yes stop_codon:yes gene_type:complete